MIDRPRDQLADLSWWKRRRLAGRLALGGMPDALHDALYSHPEKAPRKSSYGIVKQLISRDRQGDYVVPHETALNVYQWHNGQLSIRQETFERIEVPQIKERFAERVRSADWLLPSEKAKSSFLDQTDIYVGDGFDTYARGNRGYTRNRIDERREISLDPRATEGTIIHELVHAVLEGVDETEPAPAGVSFEGHEYIPHPPNGLSRLSEFSDGEEENPALKELGEATTELVKTYLQYGYDGQIAFRRDSSYSAGQRMLLLLAHAGVRPLDPLLFVHAHLENGAERRLLGDRSAMATLQRTLREVFPDRDIVRDLSSLNQKLNKKGRIPDSSVDELANKVQAQYRRWKYRSLHRAN